MSFSKMDKWLVASVAKHFESVTEGQIDFMLEDQVRDTATLSRWVELRINGPEYKRLSKNEYLINLEVDLLINIKHDPSNIYKIHEVSGLLEAACDEINIFEYGDSNNFLFCLPLDSEMVNNIKKMYYGKVDDTNIKRVSVMAFYEVTTNLEV